MQEWSPLYIEKLCCPKAKVVQCSCKDCILSLVYSLQNIIQIKHLLKNCTVPRSIHQAAFHSYHINHDPKALSYVILGGGGGGAAQLNEKTGTLLSQIGILSV